MPVWRCERRPSPNQPVRAPEAGRTSEPGVFVERDGWTGSAMRRFHSAMADSCTRTAPTPTADASRSDATSVTAASSDDDLGEGRWTPADEKAVEAVSAPATRPTSTAPARAEREGKYGIR